MTTREITLRLSEDVYRELTQRARRSHQNIDDVIAEILAQYAQNADAPFDIRQTRTWDLCGALEIAGPDPAYLAEANDEDKPVTNYAEHVDDVLYDYE